MRILAVVLLLALTVTVHEAGHYAAMKMSGVRIVEIALGFGPTVWSRTLPDGSEFKLKPIFLGGYVEPVASGPDSMAQASVSARVEISLAGMLANVIAAALVLILLGYMKNGAPALTEKYGAWLPCWLRPIAVGLATPVVIWIISPPLIIWKLCTEGRKFFAAVAGPVGIIRLGREQLGSVLAVARFWVIFNASLAGFNLIPLMPFDGGQMVMPLVGLLGPAAASIFNISSTVISLLFVGAVLLSDFWKLKKRRPLGANGCK